MFTEPIKQKKKVSTTKVVQGRFPAGLKRFGYDFFLNNPGAEMGSAHLPSLPEYILSLGDELTINTWGRENQSQTIEIDNEGMIHYPPLQPLRVAGLRFAKAQELLITEIEKINGVKASVGLGRLKSIRVYVLGEAVNPGSYVVPAGATVTAALFQSGGIKDIGSLRRIEIKRSGRLLTRLDLYDMLLNGNNRKDRQLLSGDVIFIPVAKIQVAVTGKVKRPAIYEIKSGERVKDALKLAGGLSSDAFKGRIRLDRIDKHKRKIVIDISMDKMKKEGRRKLQDGDMLNIEEVLLREDDAVHLVGNVNRPGRYEFKKGMTIHDLIGSVNDLKSHTFFKYGHIKRKTDDRQGTLLLPFSLEDVFKAENPMLLTPRDRVIVYSRYQIMDHPEVRVSGSIRRPGTYAFEEQMRVSDLIIAGGGLRVNAFLSEAHLIRMLKSQESGSFYSTLIKVNLSNLINNPEEEGNVVLQPFDSLILFPRSNFVLPKVVSIKGAIKSPGDFELTENMGIPELISQANGLTKTTYTLNVEVVRRILENDSLVKRKIHQMNLRNILEGKTTFQLEDGDAVYVRELVDNKGKIVVTLSGEFNFPGQYEAAKGERLSSIIKRAGGFTPDAYMRGAAFIRESVKQRQLRVMSDVEKRLVQEQEALLSQMIEESDKANVVAAIAQRRTILKETKNARYLGRVVVHLDKKFKFEGKIEDIILEDGDKLTIERSPSVVAILGEVYAPTSVIFGSDNNTISECLSKAGGVNQYGDEDNILYMKPDGSILTPKNTWFFGSKSVEPGGTIVVPPRPPKKDYLEVLSKVTQIIYQMAISVGVAVTLF